MEREWAFSFYCMVSEQCFHWFMEICCYGSTEPVPSCTLAGHNWVDVGVDQLRALEAGYLGGALVRVQH